MPLGQHFRDQVRTLFRIRKARKVSRLVFDAPKPRMGSVLVRGEIRMTIQAGLTDDLWTWLASQGWREPEVFPDRRHYRDIPQAWVTRLFDSPAEHRLKVLVAAVSKATVRHTLDQRRRRSLVSAGLSDKSLR